SALVAMPLLIMFMDVKLAVPLCMLNGLIITSFLSLQLKNHIDWKKIMPLFLGCLPGIYVGTTFLKEANSNVIEFLLGALLIAYGLYGLALRPQPRKINPTWSYLAGFASGAIGSAFSAGGPPTIIYTTLTGWTKDDIKATLSGFFFSTGLIIAVAHAINGLTTVVVLRYFAASTAFVFLGVYAGSIYYGRLKKEVYVRVILGILILMGIMMIVSAV
ncbi:MAG: sulfite exporter TauE/SafE family protein, partial [Deltaproteobacteria bacterium]|nr:sulfite exporter TauE/SafE family protein [Deltaproteobacteria bacterium]